MLEFEKIDETRFRILVCIDGSDESLRGLRYAAKLGKGVDADICLLYVRPLDQELRSGGLQVRVARENMLDWGLELPGIKYLKQGLDILMELGAMGKNWRSKSFHTDIAGDPLGDNKIEYLSEDGKRIILKLKTAPDIMTGILDQWEIGKYSLIILGASERWEGGVVKTFWDPEVAQQIASRAPCSVLIARELEAGSGYLICTNGSDLSLEAIREDAYLTSRGQCPITFMSVAESVEDEVKAHKAVDHAKIMFKKINLEAANTIVKVGDPTEEIVKAGSSYSLIIVSESSKNQLEQFFKGSVAYKVMEKAYNSVLIVR